MKNIKTFTLAIVGISLGVTAGARTNVQGSMEQLKENVGNAEANYEQYKKNMDISTENVVAATDAVKELRKQKKQLLSNGGNIEKNKAILNKMKDQLQAFKAQELKDLKKEQAQIQQVRELLAKLEANQKQRETNLAAYDQKIQEIEAEKQAWDEQKQALASLKGKIDSKEKEALAERKDWLSKKKSYRKEAIKWHKRHKMADQTYTKFEKLAE